MRASTLNNIIAIVITICSFAFMGAITLVTKEQPKKTVGTTSTIATYRAPTSIPSSIQKETR
jgi:hypothetical protein